jgi:hypothetical protein
MKKITILLCTIAILQACNSQRKRALVGETEYQQQLNASYKDASKTPLKKRDLKTFKGLDFFPIDSSFIVIATLKKIANAPTFEMATTTDRKPLYKEYGHLLFYLKGKKQKLTIYRSQDDSKDPTYKNLLFLPFTDGTSGNTSYGGGRYMDVMTTDEKPNGTIALNFNNTYNPYCAYNNKYSCPITPRKNHLEVAIKAGVMDFKKH